MTRKQDFLYWREWQAVRELYTSLNLPAPDRHALHQAALGADKSHKDFSNADLDKVLAHFRSLSDPANVQAQLRQIDQPKTRLKYAINLLSSQLADRGRSPSAAAPPPGGPSTLNPQPSTGYAERIAADRFGTSDLDSLTELQLTQLRNTLADRLVINRRQGTAATRAQRQSAHRRRQTQPDRRGTAAVLSNNPF
jgi:hypothetical protein